MPEIIIDLEKCNGCGKCREICPKYVFKKIIFNNDNKKIKYIPKWSDRCLLCTMCIGVCPKKAILIKKKKFTSK